MNLSRAKTVLIYAFLGLNLFLAYHLYLPHVEKLTKTAVTSSELQQAQSYLAANNYYLKVDLNRAVQKSAFVTVMPAQWLPGESAAEFTGGVPALERDGTVIYRLPGREVTVHSSGLIKLALQPGLALAAPSENLEERELPRLVQQFLQENFIMPTQARLDYVERDGEGRLVIHYYQELDGTPLFTGYLKVFIELGLVTGVELYWLEISEYPREGEMDVIPATDALIKLVDELGPSLLPQEIIKVDLGYFSREYNAEMWEVPPVWRIMLDGYRNFYVNAFTGNLEEI